MPNKIMEAQTDRSRRAGFNQQAAAGPTATALAPPDYAIDFLDRARESENQSAATPASRYDLPTTADAERQSDPLKPASAQTAGKIHPIGTVQANRPARQSRFTFESQRPLPASSLPGQQQTIPSKLPPQAIPPVPEKPTTDGRGVINFRAGTTLSPPESTLVVKSPAQPEKPRFSLDTQPVTGKDTAGPAKALDAVGVKASLQPVPSLLPVAKAETAQPTTHSIQPATAAATLSSLAGSPAQPEAAPVPSQRQGIEALMTDKAESAAQEKIQEKIDAASSEKATSTESAESAGSNEPAAPIEFASEPRSTAESIADNPAPIPDDSSDRGGSLSAAAATDSQQAAAVEHAEQADRARAAEQIAQQREEEQEQERLEAQPEVQVEPQAGLVQEGGAENVELSPSEKAAGLAAVSEEAGGGEAASTEGGGGSGGGGSSREVKLLEAQTPDTAGMSPEAGFAAAATLAAGEAPKALDGVGNAVDSSVQQEGDRLQIEMPEVEVGGEEADGTAVKSLDVSGQAGKTQRTQTASVQPIPVPKPLPESPPSAIRNIPTPHVVGSTEGTLSAADAQQVQSSIQALPTTDPGLNMSAGSPPVLQLSGDAHPVQISDQREKLNASILAQRIQGAAEVAAPAGENNIHTRHRKESLKATPLTAPAGAAVAGVESADEAVAIIAEQKKGSEVRTAIRQAQGEIAAKKVEHHNKVVEARSKACQQITALQTENASQQDAARTQAQREVHKARADWSEEQKREVTQADEKTQAELAKADEKIAREQKQADEQSSQHITEGEQQAQRHKREAEAEAERKKRDAERESQSAFDWVASKASAFFDTLKQGLAILFDAAKKLVRAAIEQAKKLAVAVIEKARAVVVSIIHAVGNALIAIGDALLVAFPTLRAKWRAFIENKVKAAEELVNRLADTLKRGAQKLLEALGKGLEFMLDLYKKGMMMALDVAKATALGAIKFAKSVADTLGAFVVLIKDIAQNPGQWLINLGAAIKDGIKNHLWKAFAGAVKSWFNDKIEEVLGLGITIWNILKKGGLSLKEIGAMVWEGLKAAIPSALIGLLIEKLVAMIVPAAGAVMIVIEGIKAAWGSIQPILAAISKFFGFLKAVKNGGAGPQFAAMLAAAAVVVIDFVANWLLRKLRGPASKISGKIKAIAQRIMARIKAMAKKAGGWIRGKFRQLKDKFKAKFKKDRGTKTNLQKPPKKSKEQRARERLDKVVRALRPKVEQMLARGTSKLVLRAKLLYWRVRYRLSALMLDENSQIIARINPELTVASGKVVPKEELGRLLQAVLSGAENDLEKSLLKDTETMARYQAASERFQRAEAGALETLPRLLQQKALREHRPVGISEPESGVSIFTRKGHLGQVEVKMGSLARYERMLASIQRRAAQFGIPEKHVAELLLLSPDQLVKSLPSLSPASGKDPRTKTEQRQFQTFRYTLKRTAFLIHAMEPARERGVAAAHIIALTLAARGIPAEAGGSAMGLSDILSPEGQMAPMTPKKASSKDDSPERKKAIKARRERIGNIFAILVQAVERGEIITGPGGADLTPLGNAIRQLVESFFTKKRDIEAVRQSVGILKAEISALMARFEGF